MPTLNSESFLDKCLSSIRSQTYGQIELIVVDNYSTDRTREIAQQFGAQIYLVGPERTSQVNFGIKKSKGKYVYRVDSDFVLMPRVVEECVNKCELQGYDAIAVHNTSDPSISFWSRVRKLERDCYRHDDLHVGARFLKRAVFDALGGFDETLVAAEDYDLQNRLVSNKYKIGRILSEEVHIGEPRQLREIVVKHYYYGKSINGYIQKNPELYSKQLSPFRACYVKNINSFFVSPKLTIGFIIYQFVRYFSTAIGIVTTKIFPNKVRV